MQTGGLLKDLTVGETVRLVAALFAHTRPVAEVLELTGLTGISDRRGLDRARSLRAGSPRAGPRRGRT